MQRPKTDYEKLVDAEEEMKLIGKELTHSNRMMAILEDKYWNRLSFVVNDPYTTAYQEGQRSVIGFLKQCREEI